MKKLLYPPKWFVSFVSPVVFAALIFIFVTDRTESIAVYLMNTITGGCVYTAVIGIAVYMILVVVRNTKIRKEDLNDEQIGK